MKGFKNCNVYVEGKGIIKTSIGLDNGLIKLGEDNIESIIKLEENDVIVPGFIDEHIHGAYGQDTMDGSLDGLKKMAISLGQEGTTSYLATTMTQSKDNILKALKNVKEYVSKNYEEGAEILGVHLEGPFISPKHVGAQPPEYVVKPSVEVFKEYQEAAGGLIKIVSIAPEEDENHTLGKYLKENNVIPSIGHSGAKYIDCETAINDGYSNITHTYNAQTGLHHRDAGVVGAALLKDEVNCELICDTIHVSVPAIKLVIKNKPHSKLTLITDSMRAKHLGDGESELGGQTVIVKNGEARLKDGTLAGSVLKMNIAIKNLVEKCGVSFTEAVDFATKSPAKNLGMYDKIGSIKDGKIGNLTVINKETFEVKMTIRNGKIIFKK